MFESLCQMKAPFWGLFKTNFFFYHKEYWFNSKDSRFWDFKIEPWLDLGHILLRFALTTNLESVPRFAEICMDANPSIVQVSELLFSTDGVKQVSQIDVIFLFGVTSSCVRILISPYGQVSNIFAIFTAFQRDLLVQGLSESYMHAPTC